MSGLMETTDVIVSLERSYSESSWTALMAYTNPYININMGRAREAFAMSIRTKRVAEDLSALRWTVESLTDDDELEPFLEGMPGFLASAEVTDAAFVLRELLYSGLGLRITHLMRTCLKQDLLAPDRRIQRATTCMNAIRAVTVATSGTPWSWVMCFGPRAAVALHTLQNDSSHAIASQAVCTSAIIACRVVHELFHPQIAVALWFGSLDGPFHQDSMSYSCNQAFGMNLKAMRDLGIFEKTYKGLPVQLMYKFHRLIIEVVKVRHRAVKVVNHLATPKEKLQNIYQSISKLMLEDIGSLRAFYTDHPTDLADAVKTCHKSLLEEFLSSILGKKEFIRENEIIAVVFRTIVKPLPLRAGDAESSAETEQVIKTLLDPIFKTTSDAPLPPTALDSIFRAFYEIAHPESSAQARAQLREYLDADPPGINREAAISLCAVLKPVLPTQPTRRDSSEKYDEDGSPVIMSRSGRLMSTRMLGHPPSVTFQDATARPP